MSVIAGLLELTALWMVGNKNKYGFLINVLALSLWIWVAFNQHVYGLLIVAPVGIIINVRNYRRWRKNVKG